MEAACGLPTGESSQPMGELHHMERWETGPEAVPKPEPDQSKEGMQPLAMQIDVKHYNS